jgi:hypothetical protein
MSTPEKNTEELLYKSHSLGIVQDVFSLSKQLRENDKTLDFDCAIEKAYSHLTK